MKKLVLIVLSLYVYGCATMHSPIPENYSGPISTITSSENRYGSSKVDLFYLEGIDGKTIENALGATRNASNGKGTVITTVHPNIEVPSKDATFTIVGRTTHGMPFQALLSDVYEVKGDIVFSPTPNETYIVKGVLGKEYSSVWLEIKQTGEVVNDKIEIHGDSSHGLFQK